MSFDTFEAFPSVSVNDLEFAKIGRLFDINIELLQTVIDINEYNRI
jgi:hypothetical protein